MPRLPLLLPAVALLLVAATQAPPTKAPADPNADPNRVRCKSQLETGSLVRRIKTCKTEAEWRALTQDSRARTQEMQTIYGTGGAR